MLQKYYHRHQFISLILQSLISFILKNFQIILPLLQYLFKNIPKVSKCQKFILLLLSSVNLNRYHFLLYFSLGIKEPTRLSIFKIVLTIIHPILLHWLNEGYLLLGCFN